MFSWTYLWMSLSVLFQRSATIFASAQGLKSKWGSMACSNRRMPRSTCFSPYLTTRVCQRAPSAGVTLPSSSSAASSAIDVVYDDDNACTSASKCCKACLSLLKLTGPQTVPGHISRIAVAFFACSTMKRMWPSSFSMVGPVRDSVNSCSTVPSSSATSNPSCFASCTKSNFIFFAALGGPGKSVSLNMKGMSVSATRCLDTKPYRSKECLFDLKP
mmetsp:Transcript_106704/g.296936  ORF Transcript_106704/g.296936 Transcript_106704/m.296936 type:complete len:216 (+) Transcript_106704:153-800(+)